MTKISSGYTAFMKKAFPALWFGFLGLFIIAILAKGAHAQSAMFIVIPCVMAVVGYLVMKKLIWNLVDEVYDCGDFLLIRNGSDEDHLPLSNIINVNSSMYTNPPVITLRLATPGKFGPDIAFSPLRPFSLNPFARNAVAEDLIVRVDKARSKRA